LLSLWGYRDHHGEPVEARFGLGLQTGRMTASGQDQSSECFGRMTALSALPSLPGIRPTSATRRSSRWGDWLFIGPEPRARSPAASGSSALAQSTTSRLAKPTLAGRLEPARGEAHEVSARSWFPEKSVRAKFVNFARLTSFSVFNHLPRAILPFISSSDTRRRIRPPRPYEIAHAPSSAGER
jgi:hypothetical protein